MAVMVDQLLPRLLAGIGEQSMVALEQHLGRARAARRPAALGAPRAHRPRGQCGPARPWRGVVPDGAEDGAVASRRGRSIVVANGSEGEPASKKDRALLRESPHLVLDGAAVAARAVGARDAIVVVSAEDERSIRSLAVALRDRAAAGLDGDPQFELFLLEPGYVAGQETALVSALNGGPAKPTFAPPLPFERGVRGRPTLVQNVETLAHLALIARHGAGWFRPARNPNSIRALCLVTLSGALAAPGRVRDRARHAAVGAARSGRAHGPSRGGAGRRVFRDVAARGRRARGEAERRAPARVRRRAGRGGDRRPRRRRMPGRRDERASPTGSPRESAGQCGPCVNGLDAIAATSPPAGHRHRLATTRGAT